MQFRCARCGQRYSTLDEPKPGYGYRVRCRACGGTVALKGADFPALPTSAPEQGAGAVHDAAAEQPLGLALAPMADRRPPPRRDAARTAVRPALASRPRLLVAAGSAATLATAGVALFLVLGRPASDGRSPGAGLGAPPPTLAGDGAPAPSAGGSAPAWPVAPSQRPAEGVPAPKESPPPPPPTAAPPPTGAAAPPARGVESAPGPGPARAAAAAPSATLSPTSSEAPPAVPASPSPDRMIADAVAARRPAFEACAQEWARDVPGLWVPGRRVDLLLTVNPSGMATSPVIDDPALEDSSLGACLRSAARIPFPAFEGEPLRVRIPLKLGE